ncbi:helix-turn-helix domain-containing protein [Dysgonomonas macrotermitis]|uniref:AraC-type DNA-binding protein n=2 Tax=Dysgonomonas macrotermitis TaxID=1346286 RepID=A0A1M4ZR25_9BACT|nr:helix-turn-helix domain-containing protein [Dysgonomonas macrotermitis]SHF20458.1 AraC-type DNA-binding protein [Dysgonomonas macrotermitis]
MKHFVNKIKHLLSEPEDGRLFEVYSVSNELLKEVCFKYVCSIIVILFSFTVLYFYENIEPLNYLTGFYTMFHLFLFFIPYRLKYESIRSLIPIYFIFISIALFPMVTLFWQIGRVTAFFWYLLLLLASGLFFTNRTTIYWCIYVLFFICMIFVVVPMVPERFTLVCTRKQLLIVNMMTILSCLYLVFFFSYYMNKIYQIRIKELVNTEPVHIQEHQVIEEGKETDKEKYDKIYQNIIRYFEKTKPYCDSEFTISQLAIVLNTNVTYISKAIKIKEGVNFNVFINTHRVNKVKNMLQDDYHNKYTMRHIYTSSGFKHQSTFNKVFKQTEGITPSEYIKKLESDKN